MKLRRIVQSALFLPLALTLLLSLPTLSYPLGWDQATYSYKGEGLLQGYVPYRDAWAQNAPGNFFLYAATFALVGATPTAVNLLHVAETLAGTALVYWTTRQLLGARYASLAALLFGVTVILTAGYRVRAEPEAFMAILTLGAVLAVHNANKAGERSRFGWFSAGVLSALSALFKPIGAATGLVVLGYPALMGEGKMRLPSLLEISSFIAGGLIPFGAALLFFTLNRSLGDLWEQVFSYNVYYVFSVYERDTLHALINLAFNAFFSIGPAPVFGLLGALLILRRSLGNPAMRFLLWWFTITFVAMAVQSSHRNYHLYYWLPAACILASYFLLNAGGPLLRSRASLYGGALVVVVYLPVMLWWLLPWLSGYGSAAALAFGVTDYGKYLQAMESPPNYPAMQYQVTSYIAQQTRPEDTIFVVGEPGVYFLSHRRSPTKYYQELPLWNAARPEPILAEFELDLRSRPPRYVVIHEPHRWEFCRERRLFVQALTPLLREHYVLETQIGNAMVFRKGAPTTVWGDVSALFFLGACRETYKGE